VHSHKTASPPGVVFDLDGTLADTLQDITDALNVAMGSIGQPPLPPARVRPFVGQGLPVLLSLASGLIEEATITILVERFREHYQRHLLDKTVLYPGIPAVLDRLTAAGCPLAVLSNKPHDSTQVVCRELLARWPFTAFLGWDGRRPRKPDPTGALELADALHRDPGSIVFVGDSDVDLLTALNAGMRPVAVTWGFRDVEELLQAGATVLINRPAQLAEAILL